MRDLLMTRQVTGFLITTVVTFTPPFPHPPLYFPEPAITSFQSLQLTVNLFRTKLLEYAPIFRFSPA